MAQLVNQSPPPDLLSPTDLASHIAIIPVQNALWRRLVIADNASSVHPHLNLQTELHVFKIWRSIWLHNN